MDNFRRREEKEDDDDEKERNGDVVVGLKIRLGLVEEALNAVLHGDHLRGKLRTLVLDDGARDDRARDTASTTEGLLAGDVNVGDVLLFF